jgi:hypothetical protein
MTVFESKRHNSAQLISMTSDIITGSDEEMIVAEVERSLLSGVRNIVFSVTVGSLANQMRIATLLFKCKESANKNKAGLILVEKNAGEQSVYDKVCHSLHIPLYTIGNGNEL